MPPPGLHAISLRAHGEPLDECFLSCNISEVARTGVDPCNAASIFNNTGDKSLRDVFANYSCYYGGPSWIHPPALGVCGFNCSARQPDGALCGEDDIEKGRCDVYCDSRALPTGNASHLGAPARTKGAWRASGSR